MSERRFRVTRDMQSGRCFYNGSIKLAMLQDIIRTADAGLEPDKRKQRPFDQKHANEIVDYVESSPENYILPCITLALRGRVKYQPSADDPDIGYLIVPLKVLIDSLDGQHRGRAGSKLYEQVPELEDDALPVTFHVGLTDEQICQFFRDINLTPKKVSTALSLYFDGRNLDAQIAREVVKQVPVFKKLTDKDRDTLPKKSLMLFQFNAIYQATEQLLCAAPDNLSAGEQIQLAIKFWNLIVSCFPQWEQVRTGKIAASEVRDRSISSYAISLVAIGKLGAFMLKTYPNDWDVRGFSRLEDIDWSKDNPDWTNRIIFGRKINKSARTTTALLCYLKQWLDLPLTQDEQKLEKLEEQICLNQRLAE